MDLITCLIVIDMQNEFLTEKGNFSKNHIPNDILIKNVANIIDHFKSKQIPIIFVRSEYSLIENPHNQDKFVVGTHCGTTPCCAHGSEGAEIHPEIESRIDNSTIVTKKWFSAFKDTNLHEILIEKQIKKIYFVGVKTNVCVLNTAIAAINLGYQVTIIEDCTAAKSYERHIEALTQCVKLGGNTCTKSHLKSIV